PPVSKVEEHAFKRTEELSAALASRLEQEDESTFAASQPMYDKKIPGKEQTFREAVTELKKHLAPSVRAQKGIHSHLFGMVVNNTPALAERVRKALLEEDPPPNPEGEPDPEGAEEPPTPTPEPKHDQPPPPRTPKAAPPASPPTPGARATTP